jgi:AcrR family transcriptional regulator
MATTSRRRSTPSTRKRGGTPRSRPTRDRILDAAERLFARKGFHGVSVRDITGAADVDVALANYHFGSKQGLLEAVFLRRAADLNAERLARRTSKPSSTRSRTRCWIARRAVDLAGRAISR